MRLAPHQRPTRCQHCRRDIEQLISGRWADSDGITICIKVYAGPGQLVTVYHTPLPQIL